MKYENARDILPETLLEEVRKYAEGKVIYIPRADKGRGWGEASGYREKLDRRNALICSRYSAGQSVLEIAEEFFLSPETIKKLVYGKKADLPDFSDEFEWQITYKFNDHLRIPTTPTGDTYGGSYITLRRLYLILCERLNGGKFFIDEYFNDVYPFTIKDDVDARLKNLKREIMAGYIETAEDFGVRVTKKNCRYD